jgi:hypothetical protein
MLPITLLGLLAFDCAEALSDFACGFPLPGVGYKVFGTLENHPKGHSHYFLKKTL